MKPGRTVVSLLATCLGFLVVCSCFAAAGRSKAHPVLWGPNFILGGVMNGKWLSSKSMARQVRGGERYKLYSATAHLADSTGGKPSHKYEDMFMVNLSPSNRDYEIAIAGDWNAMPRKARSERTNQATYHKCVREMLDSHGLSKSSVRITRVLRVDLEGDGKSEVIMSAESAGFDPLVYRKGQYSFILLRKLVRGHVKTFLLSGESHRQNLPDGYPEYYSIAGFWDVDGDGSLEVGINGLCQRADASEFLLYKVAGGKPRLLAQRGHGN